MFRDPRKARRKEYEQAIRDAKDIESLRSSRVGYDPNDEQAIRATLFLWRLETGLAKSESDFVMEKAARYAVEVPTAENKPSWWERSERDGTSLEWLSPTGRAAVSKIVQEERRRIVEWWIKILAPTLGALISLLGLVIALITILRK